MKRAEVYYKNSLAGILAETDAGYEFCYIKDYLKSKNAEPVSLTFSFTEGIFYRSVYVVQEWFCRLEHLKNLIHIQV